MLGAWLAAFAAIASGCAAAPPPAPTSDLEGAPAGGPTGSIVGAVRDVATGELVPFAAIEVIAVDGRRALDTSGAAGEFGVRLPPGRYRLIAAFGELRAEIPDVPVIARRATRIHIDLDSRPPIAAPRGDGAIAAAATGEIAGRVTEGIGAAATPFAGAVIAAMGPGVANAPMAISGRDGRYRLRGLRPGRYDVTVYYQLVDRGAIELRRSDVEVRAGRATHVDLEIDLRPR
ncbi:MAG TPA: carboxypeptidase-like regulatory domain-containing protein [Kofleriaceae bacterium]|nr:carboxypeptidase-like regulatory domain-containing protein [Kofleriaceae bacterium]